MVTTKTTTKVTKATIKKATKTEIAAAKKTVATVKKPVKPVEAEQLTFGDALAVEDESRRTGDTRSQQERVEDVGPQKERAEDTRLRRVLVEDMGPQRVRAALHLGHNSRGRGRSEAEKRESYARYRANKKKAMELEERNTRHLILFPASDADTNAEKFYNMGGNSAIIYCHEIGPRLKRKPVLRRDMDLGGERFHSGVCSISNLAVLEQKLMEIGVKRQEDYGDLVIFKLARGYPKDEIREMLKQEQAKLDSLNKLLYAEVLFPDIHRQLIELT